MGRWDTCERTCICSWMPRKSSRATVAARGPRQITPAWRSSSSGPTRKSSRRPQKGSSCRKCPSIARRTTARRIDALASLMGSLPACLLACLLQPLAYSSLGVASAWPPLSLVLQLSRDNSLPRPSSRRPLLLRRVLRQHREASLRVFGLEFLCWLHGLRLPWRLAIAG